MPHENRLGRRKREAPQAAEPAQPHCPGRSPEPVHSIFSLQREAGNQAVQRLLRTAGIQPRLTIGDAHDPLEHEADAVADRVMRMQNPAPSSATAEQISRTSVGPARHAHEAPAVVHDVLRSPGRPLDAAVRAYFEPRFGHDFSRVTIHSGTGASAAARAVSAKAFTVGSDVVFGENQYAPGTNSGQRLLAHELSHVVQQSSGRAMLQRAETDTVPGCASVTDSQSDVDAKVNASLAAARAAAGAPPQGKLVAQGVEADLGKNVQTGRTAIEVWASSLPPTKASQPAQSATKYAGVNYGLWKQPWFPILNPTMKINGICVGSDKLGHFFQQGATFQRTQSTLGTPAAEEESERSEGGGFGLETTGVFSNADREANRQGGRFYNDLIASPGMSFGIASYISSAWSEVDHPNFYEDSVGRQVWANVLTGDWSGHSFDKAPFKDDALSLRLTATKDGKVSGTFNVGGAAGTILNGVITYKTTSVRAVSVIGTKTTATPISGIHIDFDWALGTDSGKGALDSGGERHLGGSWGRGASNDDRGSWVVDHV